MSLAADMKFDATCVCHEQLHTFSWAIIRKPSYTSNMLSASVSYMPSRSDFSAVVRLVNAPVFERKKAPIDQHRLTTFSTNDVEYHARIFALHSSMAASTGVYEDQGLEEEWQT